LGIETEEDKMYLMELAAQITQAERQATLSSLGSVADQVAEVERQLSSPLIGKKERKALMRRLRNLRSE